MFFHRFIYAIGLGSQLRYQVGLEHINPLLNQFDGYMHI